MSEILKGAPVANALTEQIAARAEALKARGVQPTLAIVRVGENDSDLSYERGAMKRCEKIGISGKHYVLDSNVSQTELLGVIDEINRDSGIHGCLMFRPLPKHIDQRAVCEALDVNKDVDCMTERSLCGVFTGSGVGFAPCTAEAVVALLKHYGVELYGKNVAVVGRSLVIGRPVSMLLLGENATVTMCHSRTRDLAGVTRRADIVVAAMGKAEMLGAEYFTPGQTVIDVGINYSEAKGKLVGDVDFDAVEPIVAAITPVPAGVGSVTTAVLASHVVRAAERTAKW